MTGWDDGLIIGSVLIALAVAPAGLEGAIRFGALAADHPASPATVQTADGPVVVPRGGVGRFRMTERGLIRRDE